MLNKFPLFSYIITGLLCNIATETPNRITTDITDLGEGGPPAGGRMTRDGESQYQLEAIRPKTIISTRTTTTIGSWNVKNMRETRKTAQR
ncbi:hypothetical protein DPMN_025418 [Dreissena polymorpha]|uniref:Uncharacterized protein n=1 Tax=Dreissena polymorpha TaxID=45954 RepID=A0A9D4LT92_DREPO|nr:hypothetical protein DPMN_025418 [Dreissena polymorpha]